MVIAGCGPGPSIDWSGIDHPAPINGLGAISEVVELARRAARGIRTSVSGCPIDQAWVEVSLGSRMVSVPLSAVVSYEPDPEPERRWNEAFTALLAH